jgi:hypothetical protein
MENCSDKSSSNRNVMTAGSETLRMEKQWEESYQRKYEVSQFILMIIGA